MNIDQELRDMLPHQPPAIWIERVVSCDPSSAVCSTTLPWRKDDTTHSWPAALGIEIMAQTAAVWMGKNARIESGRAGMIVRSNRLELFQLTLPSETLLVCKVTPELSGDQPLHVFNGEIATQDGGILVEGTFAILLS